MKHAILLILIMLCGLLSKSQNKNLSFFPSEIPDSAFAIILVNKINCSSINYKLNENIAKLINSNPNINYKVVTNTIERKKEINYYRRLWNLKDSDSLVGNDDTLSLYILHLLKVDKLVSKWNSCTVIKRDKKIFVKVLDLKE